LFDRDRRGMRMTPAARRFRETAERVAREWLELRRDLDEGGQVSGELRVYCSVTATRQLLSPLLAAYRQAYPAVDVLLETGDQADGVDRVRRRHADVAVVARPASLREEFSFLRLAATPMCLCMPLSGPGSAALSSTGRAPDGMDADAMRWLAQAPWILPERGVSKDMIDEWLARYCGTVPKVYARVAGHEAIVAMVSLGLGVGIVPRLVLDASGLAGDLSVRTLERSMELLDIGLCTRAARRAEPLLAGLWDVATGVGPRSDKLES
jgi:LysR family positive regulator for ilvC